MAKKKAKKTVKKTVKKSVKKTTRKPAKKKAVKRVGACKPTLKLSSGKKATYNQMCGLYKEARKTYHRLGEKAMGTPKNSGARKLYTQAKRDYRALGKAIFKSGHPKSEWNSQHKR